MIEGIGIGSANVLIGGEDGSGDIYTVTVFAREDGSEPPTPDLAPVLEGDDMHLEVGQRQVWAGHDDRKLIIARLGCSGHPS